MKLRFLTLLSAALTGVHSFILWLAKQVNRLRVHVWTRATQENLATCNQRAVSKDVIFQ